MNADAIPWTRGLALLCNACGWSSPPILRWDGCERCGAPLQTSYPDAQSLPIPVTARTDLGLRTTPLLASRSAPATYLKLESGNPTGSHKDRFHSITSAIARLANARGVVTTSTGNHGVSCAAHAARDGLACIVLATSTYPRALATQIAAYGGEVVQLEADARRARVSALIDADWLPATSSDPYLSGAGNPYGLDGYAAIAEEIVEQLGSIPAMVCVPVASGDLLAGITRGFHTLCAGDSSVLIVACQPSAASPLAASLEVGRSVTIEQHSSLARSTSDATSGRLAFAAVRDDCELVTVPEANIAAATRGLAAEGFYVETSSALALAGVDEARARGLVASDAAAVAIITATGRGWSEDTPELFLAARPATTAALEIA